MKTAIILIAEGFEEMEAVAPIDILRRAGVDVNVCGIGENRNVTGRNGICLRVDHTIHSFLEEPFDLVLLPGGPGHKLLRQDTRVLDLLRRQHAQRKLIGAICAAPLVLKEAGILPGPAFTCHYTAAEELPERDPEAAVLRDGNLITSQGAGTATRFGLALVEALVDPGTAQKVSDSICFGAK